MENKYIVTFDVETTGKNPKVDHIIQFSAVKYDKERKEIIEELDIYIKPDVPYVMSIGALAKHKITPKFLEDKPTFKSVAGRIYKFLENSDLVGYNLINFDCKFLQEKFKTVGINWIYSDLVIYDAFLEEQRRNGLSLGNTFKRYNKVSMEEYGFNAHDALSDVKATLMVFEKQQEEMPYEPENIISECGMIRMMSFDTDEPTECFSYGKYSGVSLKYVTKTDINYIDWILRNPDIDNKTKETCKKYIGKV